MANQKGELLLLLLLLRPPVQDMNSAVHWLRVSSGLVTVWPMVLSDVKIS
jgi:hypothetical protein